MSDEKTFLDLRDMVRGAYGHELTQKEIDEGDLEHGDVQLGLLMRMADALERMAPKKEDKRKKWEREKDAKVRAYNCYLKGKELDLGEDLEAFATSHELVLTDEEWEEVWNADILDLGDVVLMDSTTLSRLSEAVAEKLGAFLAAIGLEADDDFVHECLTDRVV